MRGILRLTFAPRFSRLRYLLFDMVPRHPRNENTGFTLLVLVIGGGAALIFGGPAERVVGCLFLWAVGFIALPPLIGEFLCRKFGMVIGTVLALSPAWLPLIVVTTSKLWLPLFARP